ncbi:hypothetical protein JTB14_038411 [Gonioctena quinquepunctata]|nr:hypothetical protein JTB14_038411 [Gonioctena quinquepunctata]
MIPPINQVESLNNNHLFSFPLEIQNFEFGIIVNMGIDKGTNHQKHNNAILTDIINNKWPNYKVIYTDGSKTEGQLSDIDVHLEQGDSDSEEDSSDEDDTGNIFDFLRSKPNIYLNISSIDTFQDVKQETQDEVANSRSEIVPGVIYQGPIGGSYFAAPGMRYARKVAANVLRDIETSDSGAEIALEDISEDEELEEERECENESEQEETVEMEDEDNENMFLQNQSDTNNGDSD